MDETLLSFFRTQGIGRKLKSQSPFSLHQEDSVFAFEKGALNIFASERKGKRSGLRHFLLSDLGPLFFALPNLLDKDVYEVIAVCESDTVVYEVKIAALNEYLLSNRAAQKEFATFLYKSLEGLSHVFSKPFPEGSAKQVFLSPSIDLAREEIIAFKKPHQFGSEEKGVWIRVVQGKLFLFGEEDLTLNPDRGFFPLFDPIWCMSPAQTEISSVNSLTLIQKSYWMQAVKSFLSIFQISYPKMIHEDELKEERLLKDRELEQVQNLEIAFNQIASIFSDSQICIDRNVRTDLEKACLEIGSKINVEFSFPPKARFSKDLKDQLNQICKATQIRMRKVKLEEGWRNENGGHFLGFLDEKPVALINRDSLQYRLESGSTKIPIDKEMEEKISTTAYMFYPPLPLEAKEGKKLLVFLFKHHLKPLLSGLWFGLLAALIAIFPPIATRLLFRYAIPESNPSLIFYLSIGLFYSAFGYAFFYYLRNFRFLKFEGLGTHLIQTGIWDRLLKLSPHFFRKLSVGNIYWRLMGIEEIRNLLSGHFATLCLSGIFSLIFLGIMALFSPALTMIALLTTSLSIALTLIFNYFKLKILRRASEIQSKLRGIVPQMISGIGKLRVAGAERSAFSNWVSFLASYKSMQMRVQNIQSSVAVSSAFFPLFTLFLFYLVMIQGIKLSLPNFLAFNIAYGSYAASIFPLNLFLIQLSDLLILWEKAKVILNEPVEEQKGKTDPGNLTGDLTFDSVVFGYDPNLPPILKNISFKIKPNELIGIVGPSGCGKSTLLRLILGFETPQSGAIYFDGKDLANLDPQAVRGQIGTVLQGEGIVPGSIYENLTCGRVFRKIQIERALELSGFVEDLKELPMGLKTYLPINGDTLSGGQKQRLLLARALIINPSLLIFDEATSSLDNQTQQIISQNIDSLNVTRIVIAQRLSTVRSADRIYVLENGSIVQIGTFEELSQSPGLFAEMWARQKL